MPWTDQHLQWMHETGEVIVTQCGKNIKVLSFAHDVNNAAAMSAWAKHFRNHYCDDSQIDLLKAPGQSRADFLLTMKFPNATQAPGPSIRAGDFAEILVADYLTYLCGYVVPRTRYDRKGVPNESTKGSDVLAFRYSLQSPQNDELLVYEVKAKFTASAANNLQNAIDDSVKDEIRVAESLNGIKQRMIDRNEIGSVPMIARFQNSVESPYTRKYGAAAVCAEVAYDPELLAQSDSSHHPHRASLELIAIHGDEMMALAHALYQRAANEI